MRIWFVVGLGLYPFLTAQKKNIRTVSLVRMFFLLENQVRNNVSLNSYEGDALIRRLM